MAKPASPTKTGLGLWGNTAVQMPGALPAQPGHTARATVTRPALGHELRQVRLDAIVRRAPVQTRAPFDADHREEDAALVAYIQGDGPLPPIRLMTIPDREGQYQLVDGHRRVDGLAHCGQEWVLAHITRHGSLEADLLTLALNNGLAFTSLEQADALERLHERHDLTWEEIARRAGITSRHVRNLRQLRGADPAIQELVRDERLAASTAMVIGRAPETHRVETAEVASALGLSRQETQTLVAAVQDGEAPTLAATRLSLGKRSPTAAPSINREQQVDVLRVSLQGLFPQVISERWSSIANAWGGTGIEERELALAGLLVLAGVEAAEACKQGRKWGRSAGARSFLTIVKALRALHARPIGEGAEEPPFLAGLRRLLEGDSDN